MNQRFSSMKRKTSTHTVIPFTKERNYIPLLPNFPPEIEFLTGEFKGFLTQIFTDFSPDFLEKSEKNFGQ